MKSELLSSVRFSYDEPIHDYENNYQSIVTDSLYENTICINEALMPNHNKEIEKICKKINIPRENIKAFVAPELEVNAQCLPFDDIGILYFNSSLINLLSIEEFCFVAGHEIGHFVYKHQSGETLEEVSYLSKYREISCDRLGLIVTGNIESSINCLVKISTGLKSEHFKLNVKSLLEQEDLISDNKAFNQSTHPSLIARIKALMNFNTIYAQNELSYINLTSDIKKVDTVIKKDLDKDIKKIIDNYEEKYKFWYALKIILKDKKFSEEEQLKFKNLFGNEKFNVAINFLKNNTYKSAIEITDQNIKKNSFLDILSQNNIDREVDLFFK